MLYNIVCSIWYIIFKTSCRDRDAVRILLLAIFLNFLQLILLCIDCFLQPITWYKIKWILEKVAHLLLFAYSFPANLAFSNTLRMTPTMSLDRWRDLYCGNKIAWIYCSFLSFTLSWKQLLSRGIIRCQWCRWMKWAI